MARVFYDKDNDIVAYHPGYYVQDIMNEEDAKEILIKGLGKKTLDDLIKGNIDVDRELAKSLELCTGVSKFTWLGIQKSYDDKIGSNKRSVAEDTFFKEYKASIKDMLIIMTLITLFLFPLLLIVLLIELFIFPVRANLVVGMRIFYYIVLFFTLPLLIMLIKRKKNVFIDPIKFMISKLS